MDTDASSVQDQAQMKPAEGQGSRASGLTQWVLSVPSTGQNLVVRPGQTVVLGRTPLRAASVPSEPGELRLNINDPRKSLSKRHLSLSVDESGQATVCDFNSTNGTYVVRADGDLLRIPPARALVLDESPVHLQLGDVSVLLGKATIPAGGTGKQSAKQDQDAAPGKDAAAAEISQKSSSAEENAVLLAADKGADEAAANRLAAEADANGATSVEAASSAALAQPQPANGGAAQADNGATEVAEAAAQADSEPSAMIAGFTVRKPVEDLFTVARRKQDEEEAQAGAQQADGQQAAESVDSGMFDVHDVLDVRAGEPTSAFDTRSVQRRLNDLRRRDAAMPSFAPSNAGHAGEAGSAASAAANGSSNAAGAAASGEFATASGQEQAINQPQQFQAQNSQSSLEDIAASSASFNPGQPVGVAQVHQPQVTGFEPGSVLDRLSRGEMTSHRPEVEIDGMTSDEARNTENHARQFEMAKHHEFLPYLSLNPYLYDDLYAWLGAMGDPTVDAALAMNSSYQEFVQKRK